VSSTFACAKSRSRFPGLWSTNQVVAHRRILFQYASEGIVTFTAWFPTRSPRRRKNVFESCIPPISRCLGLDQTAAEKTRTLVGEYETLSTTAHVAVAVFYRAIDAGAAAGWRRALAGFLTGDHERKHSDVALEANRVFRQRHFSDGRRQIFVSRSRRRGEFPLRRRSTRPSSASPNSARNRAGRPHDLVTVVSRDGREPESITAAAAMRGRFRIRGVNQCSARPA